MEEFAGTLRRLREGRGYVSSRAFFLARGGRLAFGCTYRQYLNIETGRSRPAPQVLERIAAGLDLSGDQGRAREFFTAYLRTITGSDRLTQALIGVFTQAPESMKRVQPPLVDRLSERTSKNAVALTKEQSRFVSGSAKEYWPYVILTNDSGHWDAAALAKATGLPAAGLRRTLEALARLKLIVRDKEGRYFCPNAGGVFIHPSDEIQVVRNKRLRKLWESLLSSKSVDIMQRSFFTRASEASIRQYLPFMIQCLRGADVCSTTKSGPDTGFFLLEFQVRKVLPF